MVGIALAGRFTQLTRDDDAERASNAPAIGRDGTPLAHVSTRLGANESLHGDPEVLLNDGNRDLVLGRATGDAPAVDAEGTAVAFASTSDLVGRNADGSAEIFLYDVANGALTQVTDDRSAAGESGAPALSGDGRLLAFDSSSDVAGLNPIGARVVYLRSLTHEYTLVTNTVDGPFSGESPSVSDDGRWIAFVSDVDLGGANADRSPEIVLYDRVRDTFTQLTGGAACAASNPRLSADGTHVAFNSTCGYGARAAGGGAGVFVVDNPALSLVFHAEGPVRLTVTAPDGAVTDEATNAIANARYERADYDGDTIGETRVTIPQPAAGRYLVRLTAAPGAASDDRVTLDGVVDAVTTRLAEADVAMIDGAQLSLSHQALERATARIKPRIGSTSRLAFSAVLPHPRAASGPVRIRFVDGRTERAFDVGVVEGLRRPGAFTGTVDGFDVKLRALPRERSTSVNLQARRGDLGAFAQKSLVAMTIVVQIGPDTDVYSGRFVRRANGDLVLE